MSAPFDYYDEHAEDFIADTVHMDMSELYRPFLEHIPDGGYILDAGCGSGRDTLAFLGMGFGVCAIDASTAMVEATTRLTGRPARQLRFDEVAWIAAFDGIWASASLLHVPEAQLASAVQRLATALKPNGAIYMSFKYGRGERFARGRPFTDMDEQNLAALMAQVPQLQLVRVWQTNDQRTGREQEKWLNAVAVRRPA